jgi:hypothetical protein
MRRGMTACVADVIDTIIREDWCRAKRLRDTVNVERCHRNCRPTIS